MGSYISPHILYTRLYIITLIHFMLRQINRIYPYMGITQSSRTITKMTSIESVTKFIADNKVAVISKSYCPYCTMAKSALDSINADYQVMEIENDSNMDKIQDHMKKITGARSVPRVFVNGKCIGGGTETSQFVKNGKLVEMLKE